MNTLKMIVCAGVAGAGMMLAGCGSTETAPENSEAGAFAQDETVVRSSQVVLVVEGMSCPMCASNVDKELAEAPGVQSVDVNLDNGEVTVSLFGKQRPTVAQLAAAIDRSGFTLHDVRAQGADGAPTP